MTKGILYYSHNTLDGTKLNNECRRTLLNSKLPITSVTHKPINFGTNIVVDRLPSLLAMLENIVDGLTAMTEDYVFLAEHDCLYNNSHFDIKSFRPQFNVNAWRVSIGSYNKHPDKQPVLSTFSGPRKGLLKLMTVKRDTYREAHRKLNVRMQAYVPTIFEPRAQSSIYGSFDPVLDFRHQRNTSIGGLPRTGGCQTVLPYWGYASDLSIRLGIKPHTPNIAPHIRQLIGKYRDVAVIGGTQRHLDFIKDVFDMDSVEHYINKNYPKTTAILVFDPEHREDDGRTIFTQTNVFEDHPQW